jgi:hypothetical protein
MKNAAHRPEQSPLMSIGNQARPLDQQPEASHLQTTHRDVRSSFQPSPLLQPIKVSRSTGSGAQPFRRQRPTWRTGTKIVLFLICVSGILGSFGLSRVFSERFRPSTSSVLSQKTEQVVEQPTIASKPSVFKQTALSRFQQLEDGINQLKQKGKDVSSYQQHLDRYQAKLNSLTAPQDYLTLLLQMGADLTELQPELADNSAQTMLTNYMSEVQQWGDANKYHDPFDGKDYYLNSSYMVMDGGNGYKYGYGSYMQDAINAGEADAQQRLKDGYFLHSILEANYLDPTPYNQTHQVDERLLDYFGVTQSDVLLISVTEQAMRVYRNGKLEEATLVTTGRDHRPSPPGLFQTTTHLYNIPFQSGDPPDSPDYYEPVEVKTAIQFWDDGYYLHSSQWRKDYGPLTNLPHRDSSGNTDANNGSHGCINIPPDFLTQLEPTITTDTRVIIF